MVQGKLILPKGHPDRERVSTITDVDLFGDGVLYVVHVLPENIKTDDKGNRTVPEDARLTIVELQHPPIPSVPIELSEGYLEKLRKKFAHKRGTIE